MSGSVPEAFKQPVDRLDKLINKLQTNLGVAKEGTEQPVATKPQQKKPEQPAKKQVKAEQKEQKKQEKPKEEKPKEEKKPEAQKQAPKKQKKQQKPKEKKPQKQDKPVVEEKKEEGKVQVATIEDFLQLDLRVGEIKECWKHPASDNLYCQRIDVGEGELRQIASGLQKYIPIQNMKGPVIIFANLKARKLADFMSNGMVMANSDKDVTTFALVAPKAKVGQRLVLEGHEGKFTQDRLPVLNPKKKILEKCIDKFSTDEQGYALWNGMRLKTQQGPIQCPIKNGRLS